MDTFLFDEIIFGPVKSRRLGISLGINLLPTGCKICNFNCVYCECGWNQKEEMKKYKLPSRYDVYQSLENKLQQMRDNNEKPDVITFAGNGEPTMHPSFASIIDDTIELRNAYFPGTKISVLSNSTMLHNKHVIEALKKVDHNILKLDSGISSTIDLINQPAKKINFKKLVEHLKIFEGRLIIQSLFTRGVHNGIIIDNTTEIELNAWETTIREIAPERVMIYTIERNTPVAGLQKISEEELKTIAQRIESIGIEVQVSA